MMQQMRDNMKVIIWVTAIVFLVGFGVLQLGGVLNPPTSSGPKGVIAKVNGEPVRYDEFMGMYQNMVNQLRQQRELQEGEDSYIREQTWQEMVQSRLINQELKRRGIKVTPDEIKIAIRYMPPQFLMQAPGFQTNGQFDYRKYLAELDNPNSQVPWAQVESYVAEMLPQQKLQQEIASAAKVSEADVRERWLLINEKLKIRYVDFPADSFPVDTSKIGGADIETYYRSHPEEFTGPPEVKLRAAVVLRRPFDPDFALAREKMLGIREQIAAQPDSFAKYARTYSEAGSNLRGGDIADVAYMQLRPSFQAAVKYLQEGQLSDVIREERSVHLVRLDRRWTDPKTKQLMVHYHEIAFRVQPGAEAVRKARESVTQLSKEARKQGLEKAALRGGFPTTEAPFFREGKSNNDVLKRFPEVETWAFTAKPGSISAPIPTENGWYLFEIVERQPAGIRSLMTARVFVRERLIASLMLDRAFDAATQARAAMGAGMSDLEAAKRFHGVQGVAMDVTRNGYFGSLGNEPKMVGALFSTPQGVWSQPLKGSMSACVAFILERQRPAEADYAKIAPEIRNTLLNTRRQELFDTWMLNLRKKAKIEDYRETYFEA
ncbi:MAG TPA: SurA N-terminal domain-containing protein [Candidatus Polarisedimenticolia bacterium]|nr:SurA N-terminal domain-containing protein [Candidatus Polarisedimenticolia bacterium]